MHVRIVSLPVHGAPGECYYNTVLCSAIFHRRVWYHVLSLHYAYTQTSDIIPWATFVPNFVPFAASIAALAHVEKSRSQSITHSPTLLI